MCNIFGAMELKKIGSVVLHCQNLYILVNSILQKKTHTTAYVAITLKKLFTRYNEDCFLEKARDREKSFDFCVVFLV